MGNVTSILASAVNAPSGLWVIILNWIESGIVNYGWTILLFTLLLKVVLSPLDFLMKYSTKKQTLVQQKLAPQMARLQKKYANNQQEYQAQVNAMYKREGYNMVTSCLVMLVNMIITMVVFFTMFGSLRDVSAYKAINQYESLKTTYEQTMTSNLKTTIDNVNFDAEDFDLSAFLQNDTNKTTYATQINSAKAATEAELLKTWNGSKDSWLWVKNIWVADGAKSTMPSYPDLQKIVGDAGVGEYNDYVNNIDQFIYSEIENIVGSSETSWNGYYILAILSAVVTFLSQWVSQLSTKLKKKELNKMAENPAQNGAMMKFMKILLPAIMVIFVISSSASFGIYIVSSSLISILITYLTGLIVNAMFKKKEEEVISYLEKESLKQIKKKNKKQGV